MAIPKKIHYCWLSDEKMPKDLVLSIESWKRVMPDYEFVLWDMNKFDINSVPWVAEACSVKKWAFAADYIRVFSVYTEGGIYLDTDVYVFKRFDDLLDYNFFSSYEWNNPTKIFKDVVNSDWDDIQTVGGIQIEAAMFGGAQGLPFLKDCMNWYENRRFILPGEKGYNQVISPQVYAAVAQKYGFRYVADEQILQDNMIIFPQGTKFYSPFHNTHWDGYHDGIYAVHWHAAAWTFKPNPIKKFIRNLKDNDRIRKLFGKKPILTMDKLIKQKH